MPHIPPEILASIFLFHPAYIHELEDPLRREGCAKCNGCRAFAWVVVSHVCRRWRDVALHCRALWTRLPVSVHPEWMAELLRRSGNAPLLISAASLADDIDPALRQGREKSLELALGELHRMHRLCINAPQGLPRRIVQLLAGPAPLLEVISLDGVLADREVPAEDPGQIAPVAADENSALLRCLRLYDAHLGIMPTKPCTSKLRDLAIYLSSDRPFRPSLDTVMDVLRMLPSLEAVYIKQGGASQLWPDERAEDAQRITLPRCHALMIFALTSECTTILRRIETPSLTFLEVTTRKSSFAAVQQLAPALHDKISGLGALHQLRMTGIDAIDDEDDDDIIEPDSLHFYGYNGWRDVPVRASVSRLMFTIELQDCMRIDHSECVSAIVSEALPSADVLCARIEGWRFDAFLWCTILESMENLQALAIDGDQNLSHFLLELSAGTDPTRSPATRAGTGHVVPKLKELWLYHARLNADVMGRWRHVQQYYGSSTPDTLVEGLKWVLMDRARVNLTLRLLRIESCSGLDEDTKENLLDSLFGRVVRGPVRVTLSKSVR